MPPQRNPYAYPPEKSNEDDDEVTTLVGKESGSEHDWKDKSGNNHVPQENSDGYQRCDWAGSGVKPMAPKVAVPDLWKQLRKSTGWKHQDEGLQQYPLAEFETIWVSSGQSIEPPSTTPLKKKTQGFRRKLASKAINLVSKK